MHAAASLLADDGVKSWLLKQKHGLLLAAMHLALRYCVPVCLASGSALSQLCVHPHLRAPAGDRMAERALAAAGAGAALGAVAAAALGLHTAWQCLTDSVSTKGLPTAQSVTARCVPV